MDDPELAMDACDGCCSKAMLLCSEFCSMLFEFNSKEVSYDTPSTDAWESSYGEKVLVVWATVLLGGKFWDIGGFPAILSLL